MQIINKNTFKLQFRILRAWAVGWGLLLLLMVHTSCKKLIEVDGPITSTNAANVYTSDATAAAVLTGIYARMSNSDANLIVNNFAGMSLLPALSADELTLISLSGLNAQQLPVYYTNDLTKFTGTAFWGDIYSIIFTANSTIEGLNNSHDLTPSVKRQLLGEAKFMRAFSYFYLVNLFGDVPLVITTDWKANTTLARAPQSKVYQQIITDLQDAQILLSSNYLDAGLINTTTARVRPTKWAAAALLARTYLYTGDWAGADSAATAVINNSSLYSLNTLNGVFLKNSTEAIWQLQPVGTGIQSNTGEGALFILPLSGPNVSDYPVYLSNNVVNSFEAGDQRKSNWVDSVTAGGTTYYYPYKYKIGKVNTGTQEYIMILRLGEQYLIRAEARAQQNNSSGAQADLNTIRTRAGLPNTAANDKPTLLAAILHERQVELFTEWGHRWFDLKRTKAIDAVMNIVAPQKSGTWAPYKAWYPIPQAEIDKDQNLTQNMGY